MVLHPRFILFVALLGFGCGNSSSATPPASTDADADAAADVQPDTQPGEETSTDASDAAGDTTGDVTDAAADPPYEVTNGGWTLSAGVPTTFAGDAGLRVQGHMTLTRASGAETRGGGVCLVADLHGAHPCTTVDDCATLPAPPEGGYHYCAGINGSTKRTCWTRPGPGELYCTRNPSRTPGKYSTPDVPARFGSAATRWMSYACMAVESDPFGCGKLDPALSVYASGPTLNVP